MAWRGSIRVAWLVTGLILPTSSIPARAGERRGAPKPVSISFPRDGDMVRGHVPVFGTAWCEGFRSFRVEFGQGRARRQWHVLRGSKKPERSDPWATGKPRWSPDTGMKGNLANCDMGLTSCRHGQPKKNLIGVFTLRLVVERTDGTTDEKRVVVQVGREMGGIAESSDGKVFLSAEAESTVRDGVLVGIEPVDPVENPPMVEIQQSGSHLPTRIMALASRVAAV